ncbi:hypothetical protein Bbelb_089710, partial [Branchiostoma belcheri]
CKNGYLILVGEINGSGKRGSGSAFRSRNANQNCTNIQHLLPLPALCNKFVERTPYSRDRLTGLRASRGPQYSHVFFIPFIFLDMFSSNRQFVCYYLPDECIDPLRLPAADGGRGERARNSTQQESASSRSTPAVSIRTLEWGWGDCRLRQAIHAGSGAGNWPGPGGVVMRCRDGASRTAPDRFILQHGKKRY